MSDDAGTDAIALMASLTADVDFTIPNIDLSSSLFEVPDAIDSPLYEAIVPLTNEALTDGTVAGPGTFDVLMRGVAAQLKAEKDANRISGAEYTKAYVALAQQAIQSSVQYLLARDAAFWASEAAQIAAISARVALEQEKVKYAALKFDALTAKASYALTELKLATESITYSTAEYNLQTTLPLETAGLTTENAIKAYQLTVTLPTENLLTIAQTAGANTDNQIKSYQLSTVLPSQVQLTEAQQAGVLIENSTKQYALSNMLPEQLAQLVAQVAGSQADTASKQYTLANILPIQARLVGEQAETARAATVDTRSDGVTTVTGTIGAQKALYGQQVISYMRDAENKVAKLYTDAWNVQKTMDEGVLPPDQFTNPILNQVLEQLRANVNLNYAGP